MRVLAVAQRQVLSPSSSRVSGNTTSSKPSNTPLSSTPTNRADSITNLSPSTFPQPFITSLSESVILSSASANLTNLNSNPTSTVLPTLSTISLSTQSTITTSHTFTTSQTAFTSDNVLYTDSVYPTEVIQSTSSSPTSSAHQSFFQNKPLSIIVFALVGTAGLVIMVVVGTLTMRRRRHNRLMDDAILFDPASPSRYDNEIEEGSEKRGSLSASSQGHGHRNTNPDEFPAATYLPPMPSGYYRHERGRTYIPGFSSSQSRDAAYGSRRPQSGPPNFPRLDVASAAPVVLGATVKNLRTVLPRVNSTPQVRQSHSVPASHVPFSVSNRQHTSLPSGGLTRSGTGGTAWSIDEDRQITDRTLRVRGLV